MGALPMCEMCTEALGVELKWRTACRKTGLGSILCHHSAPSSLADKSEGACKVSVPRSEFGHPPYIPVYVAQAQVQPTLIMLRPHASWTHWPAQNLVLISGSYWLSDAILTFDLSE